MVVVERENPPQPLGSCRRSGADRDRSVRRLSRAPARDGRRCRAGPSSRRRGTSGSHRSSAARRTPASTARAARPRARPSTLGMRGFGRCPHAEPCRAIENVHRLLVAPLVTEHVRPRAARAGRVAPAALSARAGRPRGDTPRPRPSISPPRARPSASTEYARPWSRPSSAGMSASASRARLTRVLRPAAQRSRRGTAGS